MALKKEEITRKLLHLFALTMPLGIFYIPRMDISYTVPITILASVLGASIVVERLRLKFKPVQRLFFLFFGSLLRREEVAKTTGSTYVIAASLLCAVLFRNHTHISFIVLTLFILGDAIAAIVGLSVGKIKIGKKSLEGSVACFILCMILLYAVFPFIPGLLEAWGNRVPLIFALAISLSITLFELIPLRVSPKFIINDNLAVPVITGYIVIGLERLVF